MWFAWWPVRVGNKYVWLESVQRRWSAVRSTVYENKWDYRLA